jgi:hypothetical protein
MFGKPSAAIDGSAARRIREVVKTIAANIVPDLNQAIERLGASL